MTTKCTFVGGRLPPREGNPGGFDAETALLHLELAEKHHHRKRHNPLRGMHGIHVMAPEVFEEKNINDGLLVPEFTDLSDVDQSAVASILVPADDGAVIITIQRRGSMLHQESRWIRPSGKVLSLPSLRWRQDTHEEDVVWRLDDSCATVARTNRWTGRTQQVDRFSSVDLEDMVVNVQLALGLAAVANEYWSVNLALNPRGPSIRILTSPSAALGILSDRDCAGPRRPALLHLVRKHRRKAATEDQLVSVREHLRGGDAAIWRGMYAWVRPSDSDLRRLSVDIVDRFLARSSAPAEALHA